VQLDVLVLFLQRTVAEASPVLTSAVRTKTVTVVNPSIFRCFIEVFSLLGTSEAPLPYRDTW
jgi:hypothetical protein